MKHHHKICGAHECHEEGHGHHETCPCCCHENVCGHFHEEHKDFSSQLIELADQAWMEVLKDKIRNHVEKTAGKHLDELAKFVAETNNHRWKMKLQADKACKDFKQHISDFFQKK